MRTQQSIFIAAPPGDVYRLAAAIERWPEILPHYRWVRVLDECTNGDRLVEMAAWRDRIPVWWRSLQRLDPLERRVQYLHVEGATRGMRVQWRIDACGRDSSLVRLEHSFRPAWQPVPDALVRLVIGEFFVGTIAGRTLSRIKEVAEQGRPKLEGS